MKITKHLEQIEKLVLNRAAPAKIRGHIHAIYEQLEAYDEKIAKAPDYKKRILKLQASNTKLKAQIGLHDTDAGSGYYVIKP